MKKKKGKTVNTEYVFKDNSADDLSPGIYIVDIATNLTVSPSGRMHLKHEISNIRPSKVNAKFYIKFRDVKSDHITELTPSSYHDYFQAIVAIQAAINLEILENHPVGAEADRIRKEEQK